MEKREVYYCPVATKRSVRFAEGERQGALYSAQEILRNCCAGALGRTFGRTVKSQQLRDVEKGTVNIDLGQCLGIYLLRMEADSRRIHQQKVVCVQY